MSTSFNPIDWLEWIYGKLFQNHVYFGGLIVVGLFAALGLFLWVRAVDKYKEEHPPKQLAEANQSPADPALAQEVKPIKLPAKPVASKPRRTHDKSQSAPEPGKIANVSPASDSPSGIVATNNLMTGSPNTAMFDVKELGVGCFDNNTSVGMGILKSDKAIALGGKDNLSYADASARPTLPAGSNRSYNFGNWLDFLEDFDPKKASEQLTQLKVRLESDWKSLPSENQRAYEQEFTALADKLGHTTSGELWSVTEPLRHKEHVPSFVRMPCQ
jgi:hypothetical protein